MVTGVKAAGVDLDSIFEPRTTTKIANVGIKSNGGVDLSNRFENIASGSGPSATGIKKSGTDLNALFAELGSVSAETLRLNTTINSAVHFYKKKPKEIEFSGFDAGADPKSFPNFGSIANGNYTDGGSNARVVTACYAHITGQWPSFIDALWLNITGTSVADSDVTFSKVVIDGSTFVRSASSATGGGANSRWWRWNNVGSPFIGANPDPFEVWST